MSMVDASLTSFPVRSLIPGMWSIADDLRLSIVMGLRKGLRLCRGMRRSLTEDEQHKVATVIAEHLASTNWKIERGVPLEGHGNLIIPPRRE